MGPREQQLCELYAIVAVDARPMLAMLALAQVALPLALRITRDVQRASFRFRDAHAAEIEHCRARVNTRHASVRDLGRHQVPAALARAFLGTPSDPASVELVRIDIGEMTALVHASTGTVLITHPDCALVDWRLPAADSLLPGLPQTPRPRPRHLMVRQLDSVPDRVDTAELSSLCLPDCALLGAALDALGPMPALRRLELARVYHADPVALRRLPLEGVETWLLDHVDGAEDALCAALPATMAVSRLRLDALDALPLRLLAGIADRSPLRRLEFLTHALGRQPPPPEWLAFWKRPIGWQSLRLRWPDARWLEALLAAPLDQLTRLGIACATGTALADLLAARHWPQLQELDLVHSQVTGEQLQALVASGVMPALRKVNIQLHGEEIEEWNDWNGAVVGSGPRALFPNEIEKRWLAGSAIRVGDIDWR